MREHNSAPVGKESGHTTNAKEEEIFSETPPVCAPPPLVRATLKFKNLTATTPPVAPTKALFVRAMRKHKR